MEEDETTRMDTTPQVNYDHNWSREDSNTENFGTTQNKIPKQKTNPVPAEVKSVKISFMKGEDGTTPEMTIPIAISNMIITLKDMVEDMASLSEGQQDYIEVNLDNVSYGTFKKITEWCEHYVDNPPILTEDKEKDAENIPQYDSDFLATMKPGNELNEFGNTVNLLHIPVLLDVFCKYCAKSIQGKDLWEMREYFGYHPSKLTDDNEEEFTKATGFTRAEEEEIQKEIETLNKALKDHQ